MQVKQTPTKPTVILYKESFLQSLASDFATFGFIVLSAWVSRNSSWWTLVTGVIFIFFIFVRILQVSKSDKCLHFYSISEMQRWLDKQGDGDEQS